MMKNKHNRSKKSIYIQETILKELEDEAKRQDRTISWLLKRAWLESREKIKSYPGDFK